MSRLDLSMEDVIERGRYVRETEAISLGVDMHHLVGPQPSEKIWSANDRHHFHTRARKVRCWRIAGDGYGRALLEEIGSPGLIGKWRVSVSIGVRSKAKRDPHNYVGSVVKSVVDGLVDAGLWPDDTPEFVTVTEPSFALHKKDQKLTLAIDLEQVGL